MVAKLLFVFGVSYLLGNLNGAVLISKLLEHDDVRRHGSGNAGFTNFFRNYGGAASLIVMLIDAAKAVAACMFGRYLMEADGLALEGAVLAALAVGIGHDFPALLGFHGGKGIVCGFASFVMLDWRVALAALAVFAAVYLISRYVSLSSVISAAVIGIGFILVHYRRPLACVGCAAICALAIFMHRQNILRLIKGTESKTDFFEKKEKGA